MKARRSVYLLHRWIGLFVSLQLLAWSTGGFIFSVLQIDSVRGERDIAAAPYEPLTLDTMASASPPLVAVVREMIDSGHSIGSVAIVDRGLGPVWEVRNPDGSHLATLDPVGGARAALLTPSEVERLARRDFAHGSPVKDVRLITERAPVEYRAKPLPAYLVALDHPKDPHIYVDANTGEITARRNRQWRTFDFFWMLHTMDYDGRDDFNHVLLTGFSVLAMGTSASGLVLWSWRGWRRVSRPRTSRS